LSEIITKGETPRTKGDVYVEAGVPFIRVTNISEEGIKTDDLVKISQYTHSRLKRSIIKPNDIVFSMAGQLVLLL
jgi:type I restriction enzyme S subunit